MSMVLRPRKLSLAAIVTFLDLRIVTDGFEHISQKYHQDRSVSVLAKSTHVRRRHPYFWGPPRRQVKIISHVI
jgi:hypothetical protein